MTAEVFIGVLAALLVRDAVLFIWRTSTRGPGMNWKLRDTIRYNLRVSLLRDFPSRW